MASNWERGLFDEWKAFSRNMNFYFLFSCPVFSDQRSKNKVVFYAQGWIEGWPNLKEKWKLSMARILQNLLRTKMVFQTKFRQSNYSCTSISTSFNISNAWTTVISLNRHQYRQDVYSITHLPTQSQRLELEPLRKSYDSENDERSKSNMVSPLNCCI